MDTGVETDIQGYDIDAGAVQGCQENARLAGVDHMIHFQQRAVKDLSHPKEIWLYRNEPSLWRTSGRQRKCCPVYTGNLERVIRDWTAGRCI